ncbi:MAG: hypothetical protein IK116_03265 [Firmicutes bacterium]|nr:hypothetical protein [Bacillota bacterium]
MQVSRRQSYFFSFAALLLGLCVTAGPLWAQTAAFDPRALEGAWAAGMGPDRVTLTFSGNTCSLGMNGQQMQGMWDVAGDCLNMRFQNGQTISAMMSAQNDVLVLDNNMQLARQAVPARDAGGVPQAGGWGQPPQQPQPGGWGQAQQPQPGGWGQPPQQPQPGGWGQAQQPQPGGWGQPPQQPQPGSWGQPQQPQPGGWGQPPQQPQPGGWGQPQQSGFNGAPGPLEGRWVWVHSGPGRTMGFVFSGNRFSSWMLVPGRGTVESSGIYTVSGGRLIMQHETGPDAGKTDNLPFERHGNLLYIAVGQGNPPIVFRRQ